MRICVEVCLLDTREDPSFILEEHETLGSGLWDGENKERGQEKGGRQYSLVPLQSEYNDFRLES